MPICHKMTIISSFYEFTFHFIMTKEVKKGLALKGVQLDRHYTHPDPINETVESKFGYKIRNL